MSERCIMTLVFLREKRVLPFPNLPRQDNDGKNKATEGCRLQLLNLLANRQYRQQLVVRSADAVCTARDAKKAVLSTKADWTFNKMLSLVAKHSSKLGVSLA